MLTKWKASKGWRASSQQYKMKSQTSTVQDGEPDINSTQDGEPTINYIR